MQITIYAGEKPIYLSNKMTDELKTLSGQNNVIFFSEPKTIDVLSLCEDLKDKKNTAVIIISKSFAAAKKHFLSGFQIIHAAGGIVQNNKKDILFIYRRGKWDLPKGKTEAGETSELAAAREIEEETGVKHLTLKRKIGETYHIYRQNGTDILKISSWFYFTCTDNQVLTPQPEEDITEVKWIETRSIKEPMANTYKTIRDIMSVFFDTP